MSKFKASRKITTIGLAAVVALGLSAPVAANASELDSSAQLELESSITSFLSEQGVSQTVQDSLITKIRGGDPLDSMIGENIESTETLEQDGYELTRTIYQDGSVSVSRVELPTTAPEPGTITPFAVSGCSQSRVGAEDRRTNCLVDRWDGVIRQNFRADFTFVDNANDRIDSVYSQRSDVYGATSKSDTSFGIVSKYESNGSPARAEFVTSATLPQLGSFSYGLGLRVGASIGGQHYTF